MNFALLPLLPSLRACWSMLAAGLLLLIATPGNGEPQPAGAVATSVRIATWNVENYLICDRMVAGSWRPSYPKPEVEKAALREALLAVRPHILALQEMGTDAFLRELQEDLRRLGLDYPHRFVLDAADEVRHVALLSALPWVELTAHRDLDLPYLDGGRMPVKRGLLEAVFESNGHRWALFVLHLKSKWTEHAEDPQAARRRTGEATAIRNRILSRYDPAAGDLYLIAGDVNDTFNSAPLRRLLVRGPVEISRALPAADSRGHRWTQHWEREDLYSRIDYLLASPALEALLVEGSATIHDSPGSALASDHRMLYADFRFPATSASAE
ncbi:MAG: endonuclease/exonuclease/phosphatase family protein [Puniceicoccaceae bacterium]|nr:MAG: endonuclease/exonuclease/phosphatase family protein [Puniceicoccaceae bacterium]